jgi:protein gp37
MSINPIRARLIETGAVGHYCELDSTGCKFCYSANLQKRFGLPVFGGGQLREKFELFLDEGKLQEVLRRRKPTKWFWCDMTDMFGRWVPDEWIDRCFEVMERTPQHTHQVLTKRAERMRQYLNWRYDTREDGPGYRIPPRNVWVGVSVENQEQAERRLPLLLDSPAAVRFLSCEPLLAAVNITLWPIKERLHWVIVGGESGHKARESHIAWHRRLRDQCIDAGVAFFEKQLGRHPVIDQPTPDQARAKIDGIFEWPDGTRFGNPFYGLGRYDLNGRVAHLKDSHGGDMDEWPDDLKIRQFPKVPA